MVETASTMVTLGTRAGDFRLPDTTGKVVSRDDFKEAPALLVIFMCNHCPYVIHVREQLVRLIREYQAKGVAVVGINSNDVANFPEDSPERMAEAVEKFGYTFPYLFDDTQEVARRYQAACTPDFFLFDKSGRLAYRGQMDDSRPGNNIAVTGKNLRKALDAVLSGQAAPAEQKPSMGCNIKWKSDSLR